MTGRYAYLTEPLHVEIREHELPHVAPGGILARILRTNICGSELHLWRGLHPQIKRGVLGHEMLGEVLELGEGVERDFDGVPLRVGDRIVSTYFLCCRKCAHCQRGDFNLCVNAYRYWSKSPDEYPHFHGTFATHYYVHPDQYVYRVPDALPDKVAAGVNCALSQMVFSLDKGSVAAGETLLIQGAGGLGLSAIAVAKELGARTIVLDSVPARLEMARRFGADVVVGLDEHDTPEQRAAYVSDLTGGGADVGLEVAGVPAAFSEGPHLIRPGGRYVVVGNVSPGQTAAFDPGLLVRKQITIIPVCRYQPWYLHRALEFLRAVGDRYPFETLLDDRFSLADVSRALEESGRRDVTRASLSCV